MTDDRIAGRHRMLRADPANVATTRLVTAWPQFADGRLDAGRLGKDAGARQYFTTAPNARA